MDDNLIEVLLIEDDPVDARLLEKMLAAVHYYTYVIECVDRLSKGLKRLTEKRFDVVLLDLNLPESEGLIAFNLVRKNAPETPVVVLTNLDDEAVAIKAVREGAQDYLLKGMISKDWLMRSIRYAIERQKFIGKLGSSLNRIDAVIE